MGKKRSANSDEDDPVYVPPESKKRAKKRIKKNNGDTTCLPKDALFNIFLLVSAEELHNSVRLVCKSWWNIIQDPYFIDQHLSFSKSNLIFQANDNKQKMTSTILLKINRQSLNKTSILCKRHICNHQESLPTLVASCNGLILLLFMDDLIVTNPITKWYIKLPPLGPFFTSRETKFGFAYDHLAKEYKVTCSFMDKCVIHTVYSDSWREIDMASHNVKFGSSPISAGDRVLHWLANCTPKKDSRSKERVHILSMEVSSENLRITRDPLDGSINLWNSTLVELGGSLSLFHHVTSMKKADVWVLEDYHKEDWVKKHSINLTDTSIKISLRSHAFTSLCNGEVVMFIDEKSQLLKYDLKLQKWNRVRAHVQHLKGWFFHHRFRTQLPCTYNNSLVSPGNIHVKKLRNDCS